MKPESTMVGPLLQRFFLNYLCKQKRVSPQTVASYRDTFRLLLHFVNDVYGKSPCQLRLADLDVSVVLCFLDHLERERQNSIRSRNLRLSAIRSFFRLVALHDPASVNQATSILAIPSKRTDRRQVKSLSRTEINAILAAPDLDHWTGRRDSALLLTLYNTGARASEIVSLKRSQFSFGKPNFVYLHGKGRKERAVPVWLKTAKTLSAWFDETANWNTQVAFPSTMKRQLTREGLNYILQKAVRVASSKCITLRDKPVTPHLIRQYAVFGNMPNLLAVDDQNRHRSCIC